MALVATTGQPLVPIGLGFNISAGAAPGSASQITSTASSAVISIGQVVTSDGGTHTIDTTGTSSLNWRTGTCTFADPATTVKVGLAAVDTATGPPGRAVNVADVITFDVSKTMIGGGGGITTASWQTHVPDAGTKTIANGDLVAFCVQMTTKGGSDLIGESVIGNALQQRPTVTTVASGVYSASANAVPNAIITFADGATGYFYAGEVFSVIANIAFNSGSANTEYGQLFNLPFSLKIYGVYAWVGFNSATAVTDLVLYSAPLSGSPVAEKTVSLDANTVNAIAGRRITAMFVTPFTYVANSDAAVVLKPTSGSTTAYYKTFANEAHRIADPFGTSSYGVARSSGAFANVNASLDHFYIGLLAGAFDAGGSGGGGFSGFIG